MLHGGQCGGMAEVKKLNRICGGHRADLTQRIKAAEDLMLEYELSKEADLEALHNVL